MIQGAEETFKHIYAIDLATMLDFEWDFDNAPEEQLFDAIEAMGYEWNEERFMWLAPEQQGVTSMQLTTLHAELKRALALVAPAIAGKSTLPVLSNVLLRADDTGLRISATNLEVGISATVAAKVEQHGAVTIPAKLFTDWIGTVQADTVALSLDDETQTITARAGKSKAEFRGIEADEYPVLPSLDSATTIPLQVGQMKRIASQVAYAAASDNTRPVLAGVYLSTEAGLLTAAAADGFRLSVLRLPLDEPADATNLVPARVFAAFSRIVGDGACTLSIGETLVSVTTDDGTTAVSRVIDGKFPDFERVMPAQHTTRAVVNTAALTAAVKRAQLFAATDANIVRLDANNAAITIGSRAAEIGTNTDEVEAIIEGAGVIALNGKLLLEALASIGTEQVAIELNTPQSPAVLKPVGTEGFAHVIMPISGRNV